MIRMLILYALIHAGCVESNQIVKGTYASAMLRADKCQTPVSWVEHTPDDPDHWFAVCGDAYGTPIHNN